MVKDSRTIVLGCGWGEGFGVGVDEGEGFGFGVGVDNGFGVGVTVDVGDDKGDDVGAGVALGFIATAPGVDGPLGKKPITAVPIEIRAAIAANHSVVFEKRGVELVPS